MWSDMAKRLVVLMFTCFLVNEVYSMSSADKMKLPVLAHGERCTPYTRYRYHCNTCYCNQYGTLECTQHVCKKHSHVPGPDAPPSDFKVGEKCKPFTLYQKDCNICYCNKFQEHECTNKDCDAIRLKQRKNMLRSRIAKRSINTHLEKYPELPDGPCKPGTFYRRGCDRCFCDDKMTPHCVVRKCDDPVNLRPLKEPSDTRPAFTQKELENLPVLISTSSECQAGAAYRVYCNPCLCLANGNLFCGKKLCHDIYFNENYEYLRTVQGKPCNSSFRANCVDCSCENGIQDCYILRSCKPPSSRRIDLGGNEFHGVDPDTESCKPGEVYMKDCNKCVCQKGGFYHCTSRICLTRTQLRVLEDRIKTMDGHGL